MSYLAPSGSHVPAAAWPATARVPGIIGVACAAFIALSAAPAVAEPREVSAELRFWSDVYADAAHRADLGSVEASRVALEMYRSGPRVYGIRFDATARQLERWERLQADACAGCCTAMRTRPADACGG